LFKEAQVIRQKLLDSLYICFGNNSLPPKEAQLKIPVNTWQRLALDSGREERRRDNGWYLRWKKLLISGLTAQKFKL